MAMWTKELYLEGVSIDEVDEDNDQIFGSAPPLAALRVEANTGPDSNGVGMDIDADDQGNWSADFSGQLDIRYGVWMGVRMEDEDRDTSVYDMEIRADGVIIASVLEDFLQFNDFYPSSEIEVEIFDDSDIRLFGPETLHADEDGYAELKRELHGLDLVPGMRVTATEENAGVAKELVLQSGSIESMDIAADILYGTAPANTLVRAFVHQYQMYEEMMIEADTSGNWAADFSTIGC